ncbi:MAG: hypothetical protein WBV55_22975 [Candidatus Sulfotelmatobacter sp.]
MKENEYVPRMNDLVFLKGKGFVRYVVISVDTEAKTADLKMDTGISLIVQGVPWSDLSVADESESATPA